MKVYISTDIEGIAGITAPEETDPSHKDYPRFAKRMSREVAAACEGAVAAGATDILVKDAHWTGRNIDDEMLPRQARLHRSWSGHPHAMMDGIDDSFAAALYVGYHARAGTGGNPLAHTKSGGLVQEMKINDISTSEFRLSAFTASMHGVPSVFLSGDQALCEEVNGYCDGIGTYATMVGQGSATTSVHPDVAVDAIRAGVEKSLSGDLDRLLVANPERFKVAIEYKKASLAYRRGFYPGAYVENDRIVCFETTDWFEALRFIVFVI